MKLSGFGQAEKIDPHYCRMRIIIMESSPTFNNRHTIALLGQLILVDITFNKSEKNNLTFYANFVVLGELFNHMCENCGYVLKNQLKNKTANFLINHHSTEKILKFLT
jgi:hypothetical protein